MGRRDWIICTGLMGAMVLAASCRHQTQAPSSASTSPRAVATTQPSAAASMPNEYVCEWADTPITIDGKANEAAWGRAPVIDHFTMPWQADNPRPQHATRARVLWDREYFYFFAEMDDPDLYSAITEHNGRIWENDCFEAFLKPATDKPGYYEFEVTPANATFDMYIPSRDLGGFEKFRNKHPFHWKTAVTLRGQLNKHTDNGGWTVEGRIPWTDLANTGGRPQVNERWRFSLCRVDYFDAKTSELSTISPLKQRNFHRHEDYATLRFAAPSGVKPFGIDARTRWQTSHLVGQPEPPPPYRVEKTFDKLKIFQPVFLTEDPGTDDLLIVQHLGSWAGPGKIVRVKNDPAAGSMQTIYEADALIYSLCFHPHYADNRYIYIYSNGPVEAEHHFNRVLRYTMDRKTGKPDPNSKLLILEWESNGHNGGGIAFGPDGMLYVTTGDTSTDSDAANRGQDLSHLSSALLRLDVDHPDAGKNYSVPRDNPFVNWEGVRPEIWAHGFRNPWRLDIDRQTGTIWVGQNGQDLWEQVYAVKKGANYGWPVYEGSHSFHSHRKLETRTPYTKPTIEHHHSEARSITGGVVYHGKKFPDLDGAYIYGDFSTGRIWAARYDGRQITWHKEIAQTSSQIVNFYADKHGDLFVCDDSAGVFKLAVAPPNAATPPFPTLLSQTGLFTDTAKHQVAPSLIPYDVIAPLWSDGAAKQRFIALPGDSQIDYAPAHGWNFPDGGALVKTFSLDMEEGNPASRRRLETRVMLKQGANWTGYTYVWNDAQTDAKLAPAAGLDQTFTIKDAAAPGGARQQTWHYPSRAECLVCHSRAANFALGLSDLQMNRDFDYGHGRVDNQIRTLEHLGVLRTDYEASVKDRLRKEDTDKATDLADTTGQRTFSKDTLLPRRIDQLPHLSDPSDPSQPIDRRARSYLHANCAHCHVEAGGGNASVDLDFSTAGAKTKLFDVPAQSNILGITDARLIATGHPDKSILLRRLATRGTGQMPPVGSNRVDSAGVRLLEEWIAGMPASTQPTN